MSKKAKQKIAAIMTMSDDDMKAEMTNIITKDVMRFVEIVIKKRVSLFVDEIYKGIKK